MRKIDHFDTAYRVKDYTLFVTFVRISKYVGWHARLESPSMETRYFDGDWLTLTDEPLTDGIIIEALEILADQASDMLAIEVQAQVDELTSVIKSEITKKVWK